MIQLDLLRIQGFLSWRDPTELCLRDRGLVLLEGLNGAGKSSLFDAITWCLYGITARGVKAGGVLHRGQTNCQVYLRALLDSDGELEVSRSRGPQACLRIWLSGKELGKGRDCQPIIRELLGGLDHQLFCTLGMMSQRAPGFISEGDAAQKDLLGRILDLRRFEAAEIRAREVRDRDASDLARAKHQVASLEERLRDTTHRVSYLKDDRRRWEQQKESRLGTLRQQLEGLKPPTEGLDKLRLQVQVWEHQLEDFGDVELCKSRLREDHGRSESLRIERSGLDAEARGLGLRTLVLVDVEREVSRSSICPTCRRPLHAEEDVRAHRESLEQENYRRIENNREVHRTRAALEDRIRGINIELEQLDHSLDNGSRVLDQAKLLADQLADGRRRLADYEREADGITLRRQHLGQQIADVENEHWPGVTHLVREQRQQKLLGTQLEEACKEAARLEDSLRYTTFWHRGYGPKGVVGYVLERALPYLTDRANYYLGQLTEGKAQVRFSPTKQLQSGELAEQFTCEVSYDGGGCSYRHLSGGERTRVDLAVRFALGDLAALRSATPLGFRLLDEPAESLDHAGCLQLASLLETLPVPTLMVMTHNESLKGLFSKVIRVEKVDGASRLIEQS
jgi:DNA repair exonuclease SbcCD ATPase subunit